MLSSCTKDNDYDPFENVKERVVHVIYYSDWVEKGSGYYECRLNNKYSTNVRDYRIYVSGVGLPCTVNSVEYSCFTEGGDEDYMNGYNYEPKGTYVIRAYIKNNDTPQNNVPVTIKEKYYVPLYN
jgi:hypothetical protein